MKSALGDNNNNDDELRATSADSVSIAVLHISIVNTHIQTKYLFKFFSHLISSLRADSKSLSSRYSSRWFEA